MLVSLLNGLISVVSFIGQGVLLLLPDTPFQFEPLGWGDFGTLVGVIFPISTMVQHFISILSAILIYYAIRSLLRLIKQVR
jgi:hypothetical protein